VFVWCVFLKYIVRELVLDMNSKNMHGERVKMHNSYSLTI